MAYDARQIVDRQGRMETNRRPFDSVWEDVARYLLPRQAGFIQSIAASGGFAADPRPSSRIFDESAQLFLERGIAIFLGFVIPRGARWQNLLAADPELMKLRHVREWYEAKTARLFTLRSAPPSGFETQTHESAASLLTFGVQGMWPEIRRDRRGRPLGIFYRSEHVGSLFYQENAWGVVDTVHRKFALTARQAMQKWGDGAPECAKKAMRDRLPDERHWYIHALEPNEDADDRRIDAAAMPIRSCHVSIVDQQLFDEGGYRTMPLTVSRFDKAPSEDYGRSPGMMVLPAVRQCQVLVQTITVASEFMGKPTLLGTADTLDMNIRYAPGKVIYGGLDDDKEPILKRLLDSIDIGPMRELLMETRNLVASAFFNDMSSATTELKSHVTIPALLDRNQDRGVLLAPLARQETEWFSPMAAREVDLMGELGELDDMPGEVREAGGAFQLRYENPLARAQRMEQASGYFKLTEAMTPFFQAKPELVDEFLEQYPINRVLPVLADIFAVPATMEATAEEKAAKREAADQAAAARQLLEAAPIASKVAKDLTAAGGAGVAAG